MRRRPLALTALGLTIALVAAGCSAGGGAVSEQNVSEAAAPVRTLEEIPADELNLPAEYAERAVMETDWHQPPEETDGVFVGERLVGEPGEEIIEVVAVDESGTILWEVEGPPLVLCSGTLIQTTRTAEGRALAVMTDVTTTDSAIVTPVITAYDVQSGETVWGPVEVPGFRRGPGLVYEDTKNLAAGKDVAKVAFDSSTGEMLADGTTLSDRWIVAEAPGMLLTVDGDSLTAEKPQPDGTFTTAWSVPLAERGWSVEEIASRNQPYDFGGEYVAIPSEPGVTDVIRVDDGETVLSEVQQVMYDHRSGGIIAVTGNRVFGVQPGEEPWSYEAEEPQFLMGAGDGLGYVQGTGEMTAVDLRTGKTRAPEFTRGSDEASSPMIPRVVSSEGAAVVEYRENRYFVASAADEGR